MKRPCLRPRNTERARALCPAHWFWHWVRARRRTGIFLFSKLNPRNINRILMSFSRRQKSMMPAAIVLMDSAAVRRKSSKDLAPNGQLRNLPAIGTAFRLDAT